MDQLDIDKTISKRKLVEPGRKLSDAFDFALFSILPPILFFLINSYQFQQELTFWRILWIIYLNGIVVLLVWLIIKGFRTAKSLLKIGDFDNLETAKTRANNIIYELGWQLQLDHQNYLRAVAWNSLRQAQMVTLVFTPTNELLINSLSDDSGTFQRVRFGFSFGSNDENVDAFIAKWNAE